MIEGGTCLETCLGILLGIPQSDFPVYTDKDWREKLNEYLIREHSIYLFPANVDGEKFLNGIIVAVYENRDGKTPQEKAHAVLWRDGKVLVDPSHGRWFEVPGKKALDYFLLIVNFYKH